MEEQVEIRKIVRPVEEVQISKQVVQETEAVSGTVRREELRVTDEFGRPVEEQESDRR